MTRKTLAKDFLVFVPAGLLVFGGLYALLLTQAPRVRLPGFVGKSSVDLNILDDAEDKRDRLQIEKINLEVPFFVGQDARTLEQGVWHRFPERGDPAKGGNFVLSAHRFNLGLTPQGTRAKSPFYNIDKLAVGDRIHVLFQGKAYEYAVTRLYSVKPSEVSIEAPSDDPKLTLYSCTLKGSADGRAVVEARLL
jgi:sortase A